MQATSLHALFADHAVIHRGRPVPVWGTAQPGVTVTVRVAGREAVLHLVEVDNEDTTWWNGVEVGTTGMPDGPEPRKNADGQR